MGLQYPDMAGDLARIMMAGMATPSPREEVAKTQASRDPYAHDPASMALHQLLGAGVNPLEVFGMASKASSPEMLILQTLMGQAGPAAGIGQFFDYKNKAANEQTRALRDIETARIRADATRGAAHEGAVAAVLKTLAGIGALDLNDPAAVASIGTALRQTLGGGGNLLGLAPKGQAEVPSQEPAKVEDLGSGEVMIEMRNGQPWIVNKPRAAKPQPKAEAPKAAQPAAQPRQQPQAQPAPAAPVAPTRQSTLGEILRKLPFFGLSQAFQDPTLTYDPNMLTP